jgi:NTE family protein
MKFWGTERQAESEKILILRQVPLFAELNQRELNAMAGCARFIEFRKGQVLYQQGDPQHAFFIIASGRIELLRSAKKDGKKHPYSILHSGEFFGELSLMTGHPHSATAIAKNDCLLLEITQGDFEKLIHQVSKLGIYFSRFLSNRIARGRDNKEEVRESKLIGVYSTQPQAGKTMFAVNLAAALSRETEAKVILLDLGVKKGEIGNLLKFPSGKAVLELRKEGTARAEEIQDRVHHHRTNFDILSVSQADASSFNPRSIPPFLTTLAKLYNYVVIDLPSRFDEGIQEALHQADLLFLLTGAHRDMLRKTANIYAQIKGSMKDPDQKCQIILNPMDIKHRLESKERKLILQKRISATLPHTPIVKNYTQSTGLPFLIASPRAGYSRVVRRVAREIRKSIVGLALGSGAALGLAHIGVLRVIEREDIPIDIISGSSIGALIGALWTAGKTTDEIEAMARGMTRWNILRLIDPDFPHLALIRGNRLTRYLKSHLNEKTFSDTLIPLRVTGVNLLKRCEIIYDEGLLYEAVRASVSIPGVLAPVRKNRDYFIDGGILAPCPVHVLSRENVNKIIAVNVLPSPEDMIREHKRLEEEAIKHRERMRHAPLGIQVRNQFGKLIKKMTSPNIVEVIMNSMQTMEYQLAKSACKDADVIIRPIQHGVYVLNFNEAERLIARGEEETLKHLDEIKELVQSKVPMVPGTQGTP